MKQKFNIEVPFFPGYYESELFCSDDDWYESKEQVDYFKEQTGREDMTEDDIELDFRGFEEDMNEAYTNAFFDCSPEFVLSAKYTSMWSPREYNFSTDRIYADVKLAPDWQRQMKAWIKDNSQWFADRIKKDWSDRDGFWSFIENEVSSFTEKLFKEMDETYISIMIQYMMYRANSESRYLLCEMARENVYLGSYYSLKTTQQ